MGRVYEDLGEGRHYKTTSKKEKIEIGITRASWISLSLERLPDFYYMCEIIRHGQKEWEQWSKHKESFGEE